MRRLFCAVALVGCAVLLQPAIAAADHGNRPDFRMRALGHSPNPLSHPWVIPGPTPPEVNSDLAFWGDLVFHGNYDGFRIVDVSNKRAPQLISETTCSGNQGDVVVWEDILVRSWNSPAPAPPEGRTCDGEVVPAGFEGLHVFDISNLEDPQLLTSVELPCGSHTATAVPDPDDGRLLVYNQTSGGPCFFFDIVEVPLAAPDNAALLRQIPLEGRHACHDSGVILGDVNLMACASGDAANVFDIGENDWEGGSVERPQFLYTIEEPGVGGEGNWHSATFTWDGEVIVLGWEPGGGAEARCQVISPDVERTMFFYDSETGEKLGQWRLPRDQTADENCTIHNYNVIPTLNGRYIVVSGNYQAGTWVTEFTSPNNPRVLGFSDPRPLAPRQLGGAWSSYWYNDFIYESMIQEGLNIFRYTGPFTRPSVELSHLNPQTQEFSVEFDPETREADVDH